MVPLRLEPLAAIRPTLMVRIPRKLKSDPIVEAIFEVRFTTTEVPEVVLGKLASNWKEFKTTRLPFADLPSPIRDQDPNLAHQPLWQLQSANNTRLIKFGPRVFSYHTLVPYPGWSTFERELQQAADFLFGNLGNAVVNRYGFRYQNVLTKAQFVNTLADLNFGVQLAGKAITCPVNLNYQREHSVQHIALVRIASREFIQNPSAELVAVVDVDIFTPPGFSTDGLDRGKQWLEDAHRLLKEEFFTLLPEPLIDRLEEK
jgi:uncharacterized protein (TIGR04255 family)